MRAREYALFAVVALLIGVVVTLASMAAVARVDAFAKPSVMSCDQPIPHVGAPR